jgi:prepilin-type N-terminal cleavage/methylation domain-containing protein
VLLALVMLVILTASIAKLTDLSAFLDSLGSWTLVPTRVRPILGVGVPLAELSLAVSWFSRLAPRASALGVCALLAAFASAYSLELLLGKPPKCNCFGAMAKWMQFRHETAWVLGRDGGLLAMGICGYWLHFREQARDVANEPQNLTDRASGFTLLETLVVLVIIALLVASILPSLGGLRNRARDVRAMSNLRQDVTVFESYANDWKSCYPFITDPKAMYTVIRCGDLVMSARFFDAAVAWPAAVGQDYYGTCTPLTTSADTPWGPRPIYYSHSFIADPQFWNMSTREGPKQWRPVRTDEVLFASRKGLFVDFTPSYLAEGAISLTNKGSRIRIGWCDGGADDRSVGELAPPVPSGPGPWAAPPTPIGMVVMDTVDGVRGRDR